MQFSIEINASKEKVWKTLWEDNTFREWADIIDPETYMLGDLKEGNEIQFISGSSGYGVTSLVEKVIDYEFLILRHHADTQGVGKREREKEWTGGKEIYTLIENNSVTTFTAEIDVPSELQEYFQNTYPKAFAKIKAIAESDGN